MKYHIHENGWTVILDDFDMTSCTIQEVNTIAKLLAKHTVVVAKNQFINVKEEIDFITKFHNPKPLFKPSDPQFEAHCVDPFGADPTGILMRVTGKLDNQGKTTGFAGHDEELVWHSNVPWDPERNSIVYLRGVEGTKGSTTIWNNTALAYADLDHDKQQYLKTLKTVPLKNVRLQLSLQGDDMGEETTDNVRFNLVHTNIAGQTGMYFPFLQISRFENMSRSESKTLLNELAEHVTKEQYCYTHNWEDGDVVISEQWLGIHKRLAFNGMKNRMLHRAGMDFPLIDYTELL